MNVSGTSFVVTGGASGLGEACVRRLVSDGAKVVIADVNAERGEALAAELGAAVRFVKTDVTSEADGQAAVDAAVALAPLFGLFNCAGLGTAMRVLGKNGVHTLEAFTKTIAVNLTGTFNMTRLATAAMSENDADAEGERGIIVNTASIAAYEGQIGMAAYSASKGGVAAMTLPLARELARFGIRVCAIAPGGFDTAMLAAVPEAAKQSLGAQIPFPPRLGRPAEFADLGMAIVRNTMLNGEVIRLDGAIRMAPR